MSYLVQYDPSSDWDRYCALEDKAKREALEEGKAAYCIICDELYYMDELTECVRCSELVCYDCAVEDEDGEYHCGRCK